MHKLICTLGDNDNDNYELTVTENVTGIEAYAILNTWEDFNEEIYDAFCDKLQRKYPLPYSWYFKNIEDWVE